MPIVKIPLQHKFGIVSLSRAESLLAKSRQATGNEQKKTSPPLALEITQEFVTKYNETSETSRRSLDSLVQRALLHAKYKAGLGGSEPGDVSCAWLELTLLCQCYGQYQQDTLQLLALSLSHAPLSAANIASLLYIAGLCYQWLKSDELSENVLRTGELLLLTIVQLASLRLHYHHLTGTLTEALTDEDIAQLKTDLEGFEEREKVYRNFPVALLQWKLSLEVGLLICEHHGPVISEPSGQSTTPSISTEKALSSAHGQGLAPVLWHTLDVWQCVGTGNEALGEATADLLKCSTDFDCSRWLEGTLAMSLLGMASQKNLTVTQLLQSLAVGSTQADTPDRRSQTISLSDKPTSLPLSPIRETRFTLPAENTAIRSYKPSTLNILGAQPEFDAALLGSAVTLITQFIEEEGEPPESSYCSPSRTNTVGTQSLIESEVIPSPPSSTHTSATSLLFADTDLSLGPDKSSPQLHSPTKSLSKLVSISGHSNSYDTIDPLDLTSTVDAAETPVETSKKVALQSLIDPSPYAHSHAPLSDGAAVPGSQVAPSTVYQRSVFSTTDQHLSSLEGDEKAVVGLASWSSEVALLYTIAMTDGVLYGRSSQIQRCALLGGGGIEGLLGLARYSSELSATTSTDVSWPVRHAAVLGLSRVVRLCKRMPLREGFSHVAWRGLTELHTAEQDPRVTEAFKLALACPDLDEALLSVDQTSLSSPLLAHIADGLCHIFLPPAVTTLPTVKPRHKPVVVTRTKGERKGDSLKTVQPKVCTRAVLPGVTSPTHPMIGALQSIATEHWRRQMEGERKREKKEAARMEEALKKEYEDKMKRKAEKLARNKRPIQKPSMLLDL